MKRRRAPHPAHRKRHDEGTAKIRHDEAKARIKERLRTFEVKARIWRDERVEFDQIQLAAEKRWQERPHSVVYPLFGDFRYWHLIPDVSNDKIDHQVRRDIYHGTVEQRAQALLTMVQQDEKKLEKAWSLPHRIIKAMAIELAVACGKRGELLPGVLVHLFTALMELPESFPLDPASVLRGDESKGRKVKYPSAKDDAVLLDAIYFKEHGRLISERALAKKLDVARSTVRQWREEPQYEDEVTDAAKLVTYRD